jgi:hypothetical protein
MPKTCTGTKQHQLWLRLPERHVQALDRLASQAQLTRSELLKVAAWAVLERTPKWLQSIARAHNGRRRALKQ